METNEENILIYAWKYPDNKDRDKLWYVIMIAIVIGAAIWGIFTKQYGLSFIVILITGVYFYVENNSDDFIEVSITTEGIQLNKTFYEYSKIKKYAIISENGAPVYLRLYIDKKGVKVLDLNIDYTTLGVIKEVLPNYIERSSEDEISNTDKIIRKLKL